jgi:hypothetical protein
MNSQLHRYLAQTRADELLRRAADRRRVVDTQEQRSWLSGVLRRAAHPVHGATDGWPQPVPPAEADVRIRYARQDDDAALGRLAALDSAAVPAAPLLVAAVDGELRAGLSLVDSAVIADPFRRTVALVELLRVRSAQLGAARAAVGSTTASGERASLTAANPPFAGTRHQEAA